MFFIPLFATEYSCRFTRKVIY